MCSSIASAFSESVISLVIFYALGLIYRRLMRHLPQQARVKFTWRRVQGLS